MTGRKQQSKVVIVPCSGIGKTYGSVGREAAYAVTEDLRPHETQLVPLALLVLGDDESVTRMPAGMRRRDGRKAGVRSRRNSRSGWI
jgi:hypothetical protein